MKLSVVLPVLNEETNIRPLYERLLAELERITIDFELLFIDDGSTDASAMRIEALHRTDPRVKLISLSRNFGHQVALTAGIDQATGDAVILMDADLQHPPALIRDLVARWQAGFEVVHTIRRGTADAGLLKRATARGFYRLFRSMSGMDMPANAADFRLLDRRVIEALRGIRERTRFLRGLTGWVGYRATSVTYDAPARGEGETKYTASRMIRLAIDALVSFSAIPLHIAIYLGFVLAGLGFFYAVYALYSRLVTGSVWPGWTSLVILVSVVGGIQLILMGILGIYLGKIYEEVKQRPLYLVRNRVGFTAQPQPALSTSSRASGENAL
jgi:polyisoprenyl-phosphate glycosyltransferase